MDVGVPHPHPPAPSHNSLLTSRINGLTRLTMTDGLLRSPIMHKFGGQRVPRLAQTLGGCSGLCGLSLVPTHCQVQ